MKFTLSYNNFEEQLQLPVNPPGFTLNGSQIINTLEIVGIGEVSQIGNQGLKSLDITCFFPQKYASYCAYRDIPKPYEAVALIEKWRKSGRPIRLIVTDTPINMAVVIQDFKYGEEGGTRNVNYTLSLIEYKFLKVKQVQTYQTALKSSAEKIEPPKSKNNRTTEKTAPGAYIVKSGDTLYKIAKLRTGNGANWRSIYEKNKSTIGADPNKLQVGMKLFITANPPKKPKPQVTAYVRQNGMVDIIN